MRDLDNVNKYKKRPKKSYLEKLKIRRKIKLNKRQKASFLIIHKVAFNYMRYYFVIIRKTFFY